MDTIAVGFIPGVAVAASSSVPLGGGTDGASTVIATVAEAPTRTVPMRQVTDTVPLRPPAAVALTN